MVDIRQLILSKFPYITDDDIAQTLAVSSLRQLQPGETLIKEGELCYTSVMVIEGLLRNFHTTENGEEKTVLFIWEGESIAPYASVFLNKPATESTQAIEPTTVLSIDYREYNKLSSSNPRINQSHRHMLENALVQAIDRIDDFTLRSPEKRYLRMLKEQPELVQRVPQKYLASYLGITPISLSRIRNRILKRRN